MNQQQSLRRAQLERELTAHWDNAEGEKMACLIGHICVPDAIKVG